MNIDTNALLALPAADKLHLVELIWENLGESSEAIPLPKWAEQEALRRRDEMLSDPKLGSSHEATWAKIEKRNG
ncbi:MAG: addiction module protein [Lacipirellulaceae bacterium]